MILWGDQSSFDVHANSLKLYLRLWSVFLGGVHHLLMSMLTLKFKIVPETLVSDTVGGQSSLMSMLTLNLKIIP